MVNASPTTALTNATSSGSSSGTFTTTSSSDSSSSGRRVSSRNDSWTQTNIKRFEKVNSKKLGKISSEIIGEKFEKGNSGAVEIKSSSSSSSSSEVVAFDYQLGSFTTPLLTHILLHY